LFLGQREVYNFLLTTYYRQLGKLYKLKAQTTSGGVQEANTLSGSPRTTNPPPKHSLPIDTSPKAEIRLQQISGLTYPHGIYL